MATILIIDDDPMGREMLKVRLEKAGHRVEEASDGEEGLRRSEKEQPQLIFLDVRLPKMDGWEVCRRLKNNAMTKTIPVVMLTGCSQDVQELYGRQCGADNYITKPWDAKRIGEVVRDLLARSKAANEIHSKDLKRRIKQFGQEVIQLAAKLPHNETVDVISPQLTRAASSVVANHQASIRSGSLEEFNAKMAALAEDSEDVVYWLNLLQEGHAAYETEIAALIQEGKALAAVFAESLQSIRRTK